MRFRPSTWKKAYRYVAADHRFDRQLYLDNGMRKYKYWIVVTNSKLSNTAVLRIAQGRGNQENLIKDLKQGLGLEHVPTGFLGASLFHDRGVGVEREDLDSGGWRGAALQALSVSVDAGKRRWSRKRDETGVVLKLFEYTGGSAPHWHSRGASEFKSADRWAMAEVAIWCRISSLRGYQVVNGGLEGRRWHNQPSGLPSLRTNRYI